ncbi:MAG: nicotinate-nucleotide adenylyltransferase [Methylocystaceae bacterium]|nr:nicotinate-nucleotide adenylyltransferase [Methylocystaceae bacterium]
MSLPAFGPQTHITVGLLGGSFNPAHAGHVYISEMALKQMGLDQVWWLVSPQNPLKSKKDMAPLAKRVEMAEKQVKNPKIKITALETRLGTRYTADTLKALQQRYPNIRFVWVMGADNLATFHRWKDWQVIFNSCRIAIYHRPTYALKALSSKTAQRFKKNRLPQRMARVLKRQSTGCWIFLPIRGNPLSATEIRNRLEHKE